VAATGIITEGEEVVFGAGQPTETTLVSTIGTHGYLAIFADSGELNWATLLGGEGSANIEATKIECLAAGPLVVGGSFAGGAVFGEGEPSATSLAASGNSDLFVAAYSPSTAFEWAVSAGGNAAMGNNPERVYDLVAVGSDSLVATGTYTGAAIFGEGAPTETTVCSGLDENGFVVRFSSDGSLLWAKSFGGDGEDFGKAIAVTGDEVFVAGTVAYGTVVFGAFEPNQTVLHLDYQEDFFVARFRLDGALDWVAALPSLERMSISAIAYTTDGRLAMTGTYHGEVSFGPGDDDASWATCDSGEASRPFLVVFTGV
jgi:hypothetical protein